MAKPTIRIHDIETNEVIDREMTDEEFAKFENERIQSQSKIDAETTKAAKKAALLEQLGITENQAKLLSS